jgi:hypothetical protein
MADNFVINAGQSFAATTYENIRNSLLLHGEGNVLLFSALNGRR